MTQSTEPVSEKTPKTILDSHAKAFFEMGCSYSPARILLENLMYHCRDIFAAQVPEIQSHARKEALIEIEKMIGAFKTGGTKESLIFTLKHHITTELAK